MSILQWNIRGFRAHRHDLRYLISNYEPQVICLQETFLTQTPIPIPDYYYIYSPHSISDSGILVHRKTPYINLTINTTIPCTLLRVFLQRWITIVSVYFSPSHTIDFNTFYNLLSQLQPPLLVVGDFNCRHTLWGDSIVNSRGRSLEHFLSTIDLSILNNDRPTHFDTRTQSFSCLDLSLCSPSLSLRLHWSVLDQFPFSDHFPILLSPTSYTPLPNPPRWCFQRADWPSFTSLSNIPQDPSTFSTASDMLTYFSASILSAAFITIPRTTRPFTSKCVPWWNPDCAKALRRKRAAWSSYRCKRNTPGQLTAFIAFKRASAQLKRVIKTSKTSSWRSYVSSISSSTPISAIWKRIYKISGKHPPSPAPVLHIHNKHIAEPLEVARELGAFFSQISRGSHLPPQFINIKSTAERKHITFSLSSTESYNIPFSSSELLSALKSCRNTCEGIDGIHYLMIKHLSPTSLTFLLAMFNRIWMKGEFPTSWREALILPFLKPNKSGSLPQDYRPIALTSSLCKLLERMVNSRLRWYLESKSLISSSQFGFQRAKSTADPIAYLETYISTSLARQESVLAVFFDLEKAYDTTWKYHILQQLTFFGITGNMSFFIQSFLRDRTFRVRVAASTSPSFPQFEGVPQGSVLSTTLFLIAINNIVSTLPIGIRSSLYVDDLAIYASGPSLSTLQNLLQSAISTASSWATKHGFHFSSAKSYSILFTRARAVVPPHLTLYGNPLQQRPSGKFLGVTFDSRLSWKEHILSIKTVALRRLHLLQTLSHVSWGADRKILLQLHVSLVLSTLDYGCHVYSSASPPLLNALDSVHHQGLRLALGAFRSSPVESLYTESGLPCLSRRRTLLSLRCYARLHQFSTSKLYIPQPLITKFSSHQRLPAPLPVRMHRLLSHSPYPDLKVLPFYAHTSPPWLIPRPQICPTHHNPSKSEIPPAILRSLFLEHASIHNNCTPIYTDGSKSPLGSGFAVLFPSYHLEFQLPDMTSVLTTELYAILYALKHLLSYPSSSFVIFTDSLNALSLLQTPSNHPIVCEIQDWLFRISARRKSICFCWVPSHIGITGNERVDSIARSVPVKRCPQIIKVPVSDYYPVFKSLLYNRWQAYWTDLTNNKLREIKPSISPWTDPSHQNRRWETALSRLRIGHTNITHSYLMTRSPPTLCPACNIPLSVKHILLFCPSYATARDAAFPYLRDASHQPRLYDLLAETPHFNLGRIISFLKHSQILHLI